MLRHSDPRHDLAFSLVRGTHAVIEMLPLRRRLRAHDIGQGLGLRVVPDMGF